MKGSARGRWGRRGSYFGAGVERGVRVKFSMGVERKVSCIVEQMESVRRGDLCE